MADTNKAEKLAAARKKLKEFQQRNQQSPNPQQPPERLDISSPASVASHCSSVDFQKPALIDSLAPEQQFPQQDGGFYHQQPQVASYDFSSYQQQQSNYYGESPYAVDSTSQSYTPYYGNEALTSLPEASIKSSQVDANYPSGSYGMSNDYSTLLQTQLAEKDNLIANLQSQLQSLALTPNNKQLELQNALHDLETHWSQRVAELEDQLRLHTQTVNILVAEKSEYQAKLAKSNESLHVKTSEAEELQSQFRAVQQKLGEKESELNATLQEQATRQRMAADSQSQCQTLEAELRKAHSERDEHKEQVGQLMQRINVSMQQVSMLQSELQDKQSQLTSTQVRLKQLGGSLKETEDSSIVDELKMEREKSASLEKQITDMRAEFAEKEQASSQYQQFVHQLNQQLSTLATKLQEANQENEKLREQNEQMVEHISSLETRLNKACQQSAPPVATIDPAELDLAKQNLATALEDNKKLENKLEQSEMERSNYEQSILRYQETIRRMEEERPDDKKLLAAMESDRVAAQRATSQNTKLKEQLIEMENMKAQMVEQLHTLEARARQAQSLQQCLLDAQSEIKNLKNEMSRKESEKVPEANHINGDGVAKEEKDEDTLTPEATKKLQCRFTDVMKKLADTADEKQKLEHLVMQLQGETETIGEYVALYQQQRCLLRERSAEKDREISRMLSEKEELVQQLKQVGHLVLQLVNGQREDNSVPLTEPKDYETVALEIADQVTGLLNRMEESGEQTQPLTDEQLLELHDKRNALSLNQETLLPCPCCSGRLEVV